MAGNLSNVGPNGRPRNVGLMSDKKLQLLKNDPACDKMLLARIEDEIARREAAPADPNAPAVVDENGMAMNRIHFDEVELAELAKQDEVTAALLTVGVRGPKGTHPHRIYYDRDSRILTVYGRKALEAISDAVIAHIPDEEDRERALSEMSTSILETCSIYLPGECQLDLSNAPIDDIAASLEEALDGTPGLQNLLDVMRDSKNHARKAPNLTGPLSAFAT